MAWILVVFLAVLIVSAFVQAGENVNVNFNGRDIEGPLARTLATFFVFSVWLVVIVGPFVVIYFIVKLAVR